jgi:RNA polymerase sigma factor (sigma-70 family)
MKKDFVLMQEDFDRLLAWLAPNREEAGEKYEEIRRGLIRFFRFRGCSDAAALADETINRVAVKVSTLDTAGNFKTITYFYGFASKIYLEYVRRRKNKEVQLDPDFPLNENYSISLPDSENKDHDCLEDCLAKLPSQEREIIVLYYSKDKSAKFEMRKKMAESLNLNPGALHVKIHRIKNTLKECVERCVKNNNL